MVYVTQWTAVVDTGSESVEPIQVDAASLNESQQCIPVPQSPPLPPTSSGLDILLISPQKCTYVRTLLRQHVAVKRPKANLVAACPS